MWVPALLQINSMCPTFPTMSLNRPFKSTNRKGSRSTVSGPHMKVRHEDATAAHRETRSPVKGCLSCVHAQTSCSCQNALGDPSRWRRKKRFRSQRFVQRKGVTSDLSDLHHFKRLAVLKRPIVFSQTGRRFLALHEKLRHALLAEGFQPQRDHVAAAVGAYNLPAVSRP